MRFYVAASLLVASVMCAPPSSYEPPSSYDPYEDSYGFSPDELAAAAEYAHRVASEKVFVAERLDMLRGEQNNLLGLLDDLRTKGFGILDNQSGQNSILDQIKADIKDASHRLLDLEDDLAGEKVKVDEEAATNSDLAASIHAMKQKAAEQQATIDRLEETAEETADKLKQTIDSRTENSGNEIDEVHDNSDSYALVVNSQKCTTGMVTIDIDTDTAEGSGSLSFNDLFGQNVPLVMCAAQGLDTHVKLSKKTERPSYDPYTGTYKVKMPEPFENLAFSVDCKAFSDGTSVKVFDQSRGLYNSVRRVYVRVKACSFGPQDGPIDH